MKGWLFFFFVFYRGEVMNMFMVEIEMDIVFVFGLREFGVMNIIVFSFIYF